MGMTGYDRVIIEPSGIFDMDEFFDVLHEEPLNQWYEIGNVMAIVEAGLESELSDMSAFYLASQIADAGQIIFSKVQEVGDEDIKHTISQLNESLEKVHCPRTISEDDLLIKDWSEITESDWKRILHCGYRQERYVKYVSDYSDYFATLYYLNEKINLPGLKSLFKKIIDNPDYGNVIRIKGFVQEEDQWYEINATKKKMEIRPIEKGQEVIIIIGEKLNKAMIDTCVKEVSSESLL
jgi:G3E family GTPase